MLLVVICSFFFISFKGISFKKAALIRNLPGQNEITPELRVAKSSSIAGDSEAAAYTISLSSHISFYLIYLAPYIPFSSPALTILALYPSSTYSSTHIQLYLPSHHYKYPIHPSLPIYLSSEGPFPSLPSYIYTHISTHTPPRLSICHQQSAQPLYPSSPLSLTACILLSAGPSITAARWQGLGYLSVQFTTRGHQVFCCGAADPYPIKQRLPFSHALAAPERRLSGLAMGKML